jgi:hypothetical protein
MMMKKLVHFSSKLEAHIVTQALQAQGIKAELSGAKEYISIVMGSDLGSFDIFVDERYFDEAEVYIKSRQSEITSTPHRPPTSQSYFNKAIMYSALSVVFLPVIFNIVALINLRLFLKCSDVTKNKKILLTLLVILIQIPSAYTLYFLTRQF